MNGLLKDAYGAPKGPAAPVRNQGALIGFLKKRKQGRGFGKLLGGMPTGGKGIPPQ